MEEPDPSAPGTRSPESGPKVTRPNWRGAASLVGTIVAFSVLYFAISALRYSEFYAENWDLGLNMQAAWTNTHGHLLYATGVSEFIGAGSFLFVHPTYVLIPLSWLYGILPYAATLFAVQAAGVALGAIPLYLIGRDARVPEGLLVAGIVVYLASFPVVSALLFDFHWEAFIPVEFLWTFYLWKRGRYAWALVPALLGTLTLEVFPALLAGMVLYFASPFLERLVRSPRATIASLARAPRRAGPLLGLLLFAAVGYVGLRLFATTALPIITGSTPTFPASSGPEWLGIVWWGVSGSTLGLRLMYWYLAVAAFGFLPILFRQRLLILSLPWFIETVFLTPYSAYTTWGFQYAFIAVAPLAIAFIEGLGLLARGAAADDPRPSVSPSGWAVLLLPLLVASAVDSLAVVYTTGTLFWTVCVIDLAILLYFLYLRISRSAPASPPTDARTGRLRWHRRPRVDHAVLVGAIVVLACTNVALSPLNPANYSGTDSAGYSFTYRSNPVYPYMASITAFIPANATVVASDNLFPFVANNPEAYSLLWYPGTPPFFPFNATHLPEFALLSKSLWFAVPTFLATAVFNTTEYGLVGLLYSSAAYPGSVYLFERGFTGAPLVVQVTPYPAHTLYCSDSLDLGPSGAVMTDPGTVCGSVIRSDPASNLSGNNATIWYGPYSSLIPGNYSVTISLRGEFPVPDPSNPGVVFMDAGAQGTASWYGIVVTGDQLSPSQWTNFTYFFNLTHAAIDAEWRGYITGATINGTFVAGVVQLQSIELNYGV